MQQLETRQLSQFGAREFFQGAIKSALSNQHFTASDEAVIYLVNLLLAFLRSEKLFDSTADGLTIKPLALLHSEALAANSELDRTKTLQRLGDVAMFIAGLHAQSLGRSLVDVDYYIAMGGHAYGYLAGSRRYLRKPGGIRVLFNELSEKFTGFVEILAEVSESNNFNGYRDILRLYELWQYSGSVRLAKKLQQLGIQPVKTHRHAH